MSVGLEHFGIIRGNGGAGDDDFRPRDVFRSMALEAASAQRCKTLGDRGTLEVGAGNLVAEVQQHLGDAAHANAADTYEMNALNFGKHENSSATDHADEHGSTQIREDPCESVANS